MRQQKIHYLTPQGKIKLEQELAAIKERRVNVVAEVQKARALGDLSENSAYHANKDLLRSLDHRKTNIALILHSCEVVEKKGNDQVQLGSTVVLEYKGGKVEYSIVGKDETDPKQKKISLESPLGKILLGKKKNDIVKLVTPAGVSEYKVLVIS